MLVDCPKSRTIGNVIVLGGVRIEEAVAGGRAARPEAIERVYCSIESSEGGGGALRLG